MLPYPLLLNRHSLVWFAGYTTEGDIYILGILQRKKFFLPPKESFKEPRFHLEWTECNFTNTKFISSFLNVPDIPL